MNKKGAWGVLVILVVVVIIFGGVIYQLSYSLSRGTETITIKEKWVKYHNNDAKYLVSSTQNEVYQITDSLLYWRWNSSDLYAYLEPGMVCQIQYQGFRFPFFSDYKNIIKANCTK